ncbi:MAG TPA: MATE family efflux transporter [Clostridiales bacterium]|nr:MATE family efflux transporter [Clostridiales bacterium]
MLQTPVAKLVLSLAAPTVASQLISIIYNTADTYFVSHISTSASAAVGVVFSLQSIIQAYGFGVSMGAGSLISLRLGEKKDLEANRCASSGLLAELAGGLLMLILGLLYLKPLMCALGATQTMLPHACAYGRIILMGAPVMCCSFILNCILRAEGAALASMIGLCSGGLINIALDPLLIFTFQMGTAGAAAATVASQCVSLVILMIAFCRTKSIVQLRPRYISRRLRDYVQIVTVGFPTIARQGMASFASALMNVQGAVYGDVAVAALTISNKVYLLVRNIVIGIGQGFQPVAGYNYGAGDNKRTREAFIFVVKLGTVVCTLAAGILAAFAGPIIGWFRADPEVIAIGRVALLYACAVMPFMAYSTFVNQLYQCLGFKVPATVLASLRQGICFLPLIFLLPHFLGLQGVQMTQPGSDLLTFFICIPFQIVFFRKHLRDNA